MCIHDHAETHLLSICIDAFCVTLDKRPLKTSGGKLLEIPKSKPLLATLIAYEWDNQEKLIKPHALPLVSTQIT